MDAFRETRPARGRCSGLLAAFARNTRGVAAIEFAFIAPLLLALYFVTMEVSQAIDTSKKVGRVASMSADLLTQQESTTKSEIDAILQIGGAILQPYNRSMPTITATAIQITTDAMPKVQVVWSRRLAAGNVQSTPFTAGTITTVPDKLKVPGSFLIHVEAQLSYKPVITWTADQKTTLGLTAAFDSINMDESYYLRPRMSSSIACSDC
jgi:Flp pilus assembly protein TadG